MTGPGWTIDRARNGRPALRRPDGSWAESRFAPDVDADRRVGEAGVVAGDRVLVLGSGAGELPAAALRASAPGGEVVVAEPDADLHAAITAAIRAAGNDAVAACWTAPGMRLLDPAHDGPQAFLCRIAASGPFDRVVVHPALSLPPGFEDLEQRLRDLEVRRRSGHRFRGFLEENEAANSAAFVAAPGVSGWEKALAGDDVIVAGGGPSLVRAAACIPSTAHWIAVGTALGELQARGIDPLVAVITDPQPLAATPYAGLPSRVRPPLVAFPTTAPAAVAASRGRLVAAYPEGEGGSALREARLRVGELPAGGTVVTTALGLAALLGASRVLLAGVDLVETATRTHADGTPHAAARLGTLARFGTLEGGARARSERLKASGDVVEVVTASGGRALSRRNLVLYGRAIADLVRRPGFPLVVQLDPGALEIPGVHLDPAARPAPSRRSLPWPPGRHGAPRG